MNNPWLAMEVMNTEIRLPLHDSGDNQQLVLVSSVRPPHPLDETHPV